MKKYGNMIPCFRCAETKPRGEFHGSRLLELCPICKKCSNAASRKWRKENPERVRRLNKKHQRARRCAGASYKQFPVHIRCRKCGETKERQSFHLSMLARSDYACKSCHAVATTENKRIRRGLPPKKEESRPQLPDWSKY